MKDLEYFSFMRNHYYYGKFLSADTLDAEQKYMNNKRRFLNRFLHGNGVIFGMGILKVDSQTIAVQPGTALDFSGREIIIEKPLLLTLESLKYNENSEATVRYLCIEYDECPKTAVCSEYPDENSEEYENISENYRFYLTSYEPESVGSMARRFYEQTETIYTSEDFTVKQIFPVMVCAGSEAVLKVIIGRRNHSKTIVFKYQIRLNGMKYKEDNIITISFDSRIQPMKNDTAQLSFPFHVLINAEGESGSIETISESFSSELSAPASGFSVCRMNTKIVVDRLKERLLKKFRDEGMQMIFQDNVKQPPVCLAKITLENNNGKSDIAEVIEMPFSQYIYSNLTNELYSLFEEKTCISEKNSDKTENKNFNELEKIEKQYSFSSGTTKISMPMGGKTGQCFYSEPVAHGLGIGNTAVILGLDSGNQEIVYGDTGVFENINISMAVKINSQQGNFVIGIKLKEPVAVSSLNIHWTAVHTHKTEFSEHHPSMQIMPSITSISVMESITFEIRFEQMEKQQIHWKIAEGARGGVITEGGIYTAPNTPGVYQIIATADENRIQASAFIAVRDLK